MERKTLAVGKSTHLHITEVPGDLRLTGWKESRIKAKTNGNQLDLFADGDLVSLACDSDLIVSVPQDAEISIDLVNGDASLRVLDGSLLIKQVDGDLALRNVGSVIIENAEGNLVVRHANGALRVDMLAGDASVRDVQGDVALNNIKGDLHVRDLQANLNAIIEGDVIAYLHPNADAAYNLESEADILLRLPDEVDAHIVLSAAGGLDIKLFGVEKSDQTERSLTLGSGSATLNISAGGDMLVTSHSDDWADLADFDISLPFIGADFPGLSDDYGEALRRKVEEAARKVEEKMHKSEHKFRAADRYAQRMARQAERHVERLIHFQKGPAPPRRPRRPLPPAEPVTDTERLLVLKMLEEKKITAAEAEKLLSALE